MLKNLISLVFLLITFYYTYAYSDTNSIILPKIKPKELSTTIKKEKLSTILPANKPKIKKKFTITKKNILPKSKPKSKNC